MFTSSGRCAPTSTGSRKYRQNQQNRQSSRGPPHFLLQPPAFSYERQSLLDGSLVASLAATCPQLLFDLPGIAFGMPSLTVDGAPSTRSFASLRPRPVISRM